MFTPYIFGQFIDAGLVMSSLGVAGLTDSATQAALSVLLIPILHEQAKAEERTLRVTHGDLYREYEKNVPYAVVPFVDVVFEELED